MWQKNPMLILKLFMDNVIVPARPGGPGGPGGPGAPETPTCAAPNCPEKDTQVLNY